MGLFNFLTKNLLYPLLNYKMTYEYLMIAPV